MALFDKINELAGTTDSFTTDAAIIDALRTLVFVRSRTALTLGLMICRFLHAFGDANWSVIVSSYSSVEFSIKTSWMVHVDFAAATLSC